MLEERCQCNEDTTLTGIKSKVTAIHLPADPGRAIKWSQDPCGSLGYDRLTMHLSGEAPDRNASVLKVQFEEDMQAETRIIENDSGCIELPVYLSTIHTFGGSP